MTPGVCGVCVLVLAGRFRKLDVYLLVMGIDAQAVFAAGADLGRFCA